MRLLVCLRSLWERYRELAWERQSSPSEGRYW